MTMDHEEDTAADWSAKELSVLRSAEMDVPPRGSLDKTLAAIGAGAALGVGIGAGSASSVGSAVKLAGFTRWSAAMKWLTAAAIGAGAASAALIVHRKHVAQAPELSAAPTAVMSALAVPPSAAPEPAAQAPEPSPLPPVVAEMVLPLKTSAALSVPARTDTAPAASTRDSKETLAAEIRLIDEARAQLRAGNAKGSLDKLTEYDTLVGRGGSMRAEATVVRIEALQASGDAARAAALGEKFLSKNPSSAYADYVKRVLARTP